MKSLGTKDGVEWVEIEIPLNEFMKGTTVDDLKSIVRLRGVDPKIYGETPERFSMWFQGPRIQ